MAYAHGEARRMLQRIRRARVLQRRSQHGVAAEFWYHQSKVSRLESDRGTEDIRVPRAIAQELNIPPDELGLAPSQAVSVADQEADDMHRRTFLAAIIAALAAPAGSSTSHTALVQALPPRPGPAGTGGPQDTAVLYERVGSARRLCRTCHYAELERTLPSLIADL
ncbi:helix-turn-helix domain-containing protein [Streptomyces sp. NPDC014802]|uniref:helix-turn-helix domain-containing protein n=1 Tax=Streptomyces sp. NPDC014802 TaxID=3364917 RepID=UPI0036FB4C37